jgi:hypothetical protein
MSAYASLFNIDLNMQERLIKFAGYSTADEQLDFEAKALKYVVAKDTFNFLKTIFDRSERIFETFSEEGEEILFLTRDSFIQRILNSQQVLPFSIYYVHHLDVFMNILMYFRDYITL